jgi:hypothetical protein
MLDKDTRQGQWVVRKSARGYEYRVWQRARVPKIPQHFLDCSIYLYDSKEAAEDGEHFGGSGCLVSVESTPIYDPTSFKDGWYRKVLLHFPPHLYAVTNKHVVEQGCPVIRLNTVDGEIDVLELNPQDWIPHPDGDDLAIAPIDLPPSKHTYIPISIHLFVGRNSAVSYLGAGDDTFMVGRFINHAGKQRNTPALRFGSIAMMPFEKIKLPTGHMQEAFLVETRSISGYSGSPVFVYKPAEWDSRIYADNPQSGLYNKSITDIVGHVTFLGIDCGHVLDYHDVLNKGGKPHGLEWKVASNTGMAIVIPAWRLEQLLNIPEFVMERQRKNSQYQEEQEAEEQKSGVAFDVKKRPEGFTAEDYQEALKRASRKISSPDEEKGET